MKITVKQLKQLIREQVEEMAGANRSPQVEELLASIRALSPDQYRAFKAALKAEDVRPSNILSQALAEKDWETINLEIRDELFQKAKQKLGERFALKLADQLTGLAHGEEGDTEFVIKALRKLGYKI